jgi:hypothetical protein
MLVYVDVVTSIFSYGSLFEITYTVLREQFCAFQSELVSFLANSYNFLSCAQWIPRFAAIVLLSAIFIGRLRPPCVARRSKGARDWWPRNYVLGQQHHLWSSSRYIFLRFLTTSSLSPAFHKSLLLWKNTHIKTQLSPENTSAIYGNETTIPVSYVLELPSTQL